MQVFARAFRSPSKTGRNTLDSRSFLDHRAPLEKMVVHGHTVAEEAEMLPIASASTGAYHSDRLTALMLENTDRHVFST